MEQRTTEWFLARKGKFTASEIYNLLTTSRKKDEVFGDTALTYIKEKVSEYLMNENVFIDMQTFAFSSTATRWGEQYESEAREWYQYLTGNMVSETGFIPYSDHTGGSPDGLIEDGEGLIEIKCPFNSSNHIEYMLMQSPEDLLSASKAYYWQCQANMLFAGRQYTDFISYDPRMSELLKMKVLRIKADTKAFDLLKSRISLAEERLNEMVSEITKIGLEQFKKMYREAS